jgi:site-specific DNA recombinase
MKNIEKIALIYTRVSSTRQQTEGTGNHSQEVRCREMAQKMQWPIEKVFTDTFTGAGDFIKRPAMRDLIAYIDENKYKNYIVIFDDLKRLARDTSQHLALRMVFKSRNVELSCLNFNLEESPEGEFIETVIAASGQMERKQNQRQVIQKQRARLSEGYWPHRSFYGYEQKSEPGQGKVSTLLPSSEYIKEAFEGFAYGRFKTLVDVGQFLQSKGAVKRVSKAKAGEAALPILKNIFYAGFVHYPSKDIHMIPGKHKSIVSLDIYNKVQERLKKIISNEREKQIYREEFDLRGILRCIHCKAKMRSYNTVKTRPNGMVQKNYYYDCRNKDCIEGYGKTLRVNDIHSKFFATLEKVSPGEAVIKLGIEAFQEDFQEFKNELSVNSKHQEVSIAEIQTQIDNLIDLTSKPMNDILLGRYQDKLEKLIIEKITLEQKQVNSIDIETVSRTSMEKVLNTLKSPYGIWRNTLPEKKQELYNFIFTEDFYSDSTYSCRTPTLSPIYLYLQDISEKVEASESEIPDLWRWAESNRRAKGKP